MGKDNWERRVLQSWGSNFRMDINNPQSTLGGAEVYSFYGVTDDEDVNIFGLQQNGIFKVYNDKGIEIIGGAKAEGDGVDILIAGKNGDVVINADKNGRVKIRGKNIMIQADEDVDITGGRNVTLNAGSGRVLVKGNTLEKDGLKGNLLEPEEEWASRVFEGTGLPEGDFGDLTSSFGGISGVEDIAGLITKTAQQSLGSALGGVLDGIL